MNFTKMEINKDIALVMQVGINFSNSIQIEDNP